MGTPASWIAVQRVPSSIFLPCVSEEPERYSSQLTVGGLGENCVNLAFLSYDGVVGVAGHRCAEGEDSEGGLGG
jgi:hypothetical protein